MADPLAAVTTIGQAIARSQMFGCENESQGMVMALHCMVKGADPLSLVQSYHLMHGRLTLKAEEMLARVARFGDYEIVERSPDAAEIVVKYNGRTWRERFTWEEAKLEPFVYNGKPKEIMPLLLAGKFDKLTFSTNYATPRRRMQHLWARVVSDAVRAVAPDLLGGAYTPQEMHQALIDDGKIPASTPLADDYQGAEAEFEVKPEPAPEAPEPAAEASQEWTVEPESQPAPEPASEQQVAEIKLLLNQIVQLEGMAPLANRVRSHFQDHGIKAFADLNRQEAQTFINALSTKNLELFFEMSLQGYKVARSKEDSGNQ